MNFTVLFLDVKTQIKAPLLVAAADLETCKKALNQWRVNQLKKGQKVLIISIDSV